MSQPNNTEYLQKKLAKICVREGCEEECSPDSDECPPHHEDSKKRKRESAARIRAERRQKQRCAQCGKRSKRFRCRVCYQKIHGVDKPPDGVDKREEVWREDPGTSWLRFRGKAKRGRLTREQQLDEYKRESRWARRKLEEFEEGIDELKIEIDLPPIQREARRREVWSHAEFAGRIIDGVVGE